MAKIIQVRTIGEEPLDPREFHQFIEQSGGKILPAPLIFPLMFIFSGDESLKSKIEEKYPGQQVTVLGDSAE